MNNSLIVIGTVDIILYDKNFKIKEERHIKNKIVNTGLMYISKRMTNGGLPDQMGYMALGTGSTAPDAANTGLVTECPTNIGTRSATINSLSTTLPKITYSTTFLPGNCTASITEAGIFDTASYNQGIMLCRTVFTEVIKGVDDTMGIAWSIVFSAP